MYSFDVQLNELEMQFLLHSLTKCTNNADRTLPTQPRQYYASSKRPYPGV